MPPGGPCRLCRAGCLPRSGLWVDTGQRTPSVPGRPTWRLDVALKVPMCLLSVPLPGHSSSGDAYPVLGTPGASSLA